MFEKEAEEYANNWKINKNNDLNFAELVELRAVIYKANKDGAEFGYNKAKKDAEEYVKTSTNCYKDCLAGLKAGRPEWHKVADGDLPPTSGEMHAERYPILACTKNGYVTVAIRRKHGRAYEWFCSDYDGNTLYLDKEVIAWCEIPKYTEE